MKRETGIDVLRGVSILAVLLYHYGYFDLGLYGVMLFFAISGYCMSPSVSSTDSASGFLGKRWTRLLPALIVCAFITSAVEFFIPVEGRGQTLSDIGWQFFCMPLADLPCSFKRNYSLVDGAYWSLAVEFKFYALLAIAYFFISRKHFYTVFGGMMLLSMVGVVFFSRGASEFYAFIPYFFGGMAVYQWKQGKQKEGIIGVSTAVLCSLVFQLNVRTESIPPSWITLGVFVLSLALLYYSGLFVRFQESIIVRGFLFLGAVSYPLYLLHQDISLAIFSVLTKVWWSKLLAISLILPTAYLVHRYIENMLHKKKKREVLHANLARAA